MLISTSHSSVTGRASTLVRGPGPKASASFSAQPAEALETRRDRARVGRAVSGAVSSATTASAVLDAFPGFVYPSIHDASALEQAQILEGLDRLPLHHVSNIDSINMVPEIASGREGWVILGRAHDYGLSNDIELSRLQLDTPGKFQDTLIHEVGHSVDYSHKPYPLGPGASSNGQYGHGPHVTEYAKTNPKEDFAESYQEYQQRPENLREVSAEKHADMERIHRLGPLEKLVDRKEFRETGKLVGQLMGPNKPTRQVIETARSAAGALQLANGISQWAGSAGTGDGMQHASGILNTISGALMLSGVSPLAGVGVQGANLALSGAVKRGQLSAPEVESTIALPVRPLESLFGRNSTPIQSDHRPGKVLAVAAGGALGGAVGGLAGPYLGVLAGYHVAGAVGGVVGLVAGGVLGFVGGSQLGGRAGAALAELASP